MKNKLPAWNLSDLYSGIKDEKISQDMEKYKKLNEKLEKDYKGKISALSGEAFSQAMKIYEEIVVLGHFLGGFGYLNMCTQMNNKDATIFFQNISEKLTDYSKNSVFFSLEINQLSEEQIKKLLQNEKVANYKPWLDRLRLFKKYELSEEMESLLMEKSVTSSSAWVRLYDEYSAELKYVVDGKEYNDSEISKLTQDQNIELRHKAGREINRVSKENDNLFSFIYNMILKDKAIEDEKRGFKAPIDSQNLANNVEGEVVESLVASVTANYKNIAHRFYKLKAKWLGVEKLSYWDRNAPLPFEADKDYAWDEAVKIVLQAYQDFSPKLHEIALDFFDKNWIDVPVRNGKRSGAFAHPVSSHAHPYLFLNYTGKLRDVLTLAHELGHGCHMRLSGKQGELQDDTPLTLAEVASVFAESLTFKKLLETIDDDKLKLCLIAGKVNDMINTAIRQIAFHNFETRAHRERKLGEVSSEKFIAFWQEEMKESLGDYVEVNEDCEYIWSQVSHFYHLPFYVYAYSFADCVVNSLYSVYRGGKVENFADKYLHMLSETGVKKYDELLKPFGLDAKDEKFWNMGLGVISEYIDELERLDKKLRL
ncbi:MAG: M3 family oligoendopeptidase [Alphaproteobacteria bacterium]|nr:M3 family oligoendopeptidase [Alphaproteobacteria bacterium]